MDFNENVGEKCLKRAPRLKTGPLLNLYEGIYNMNLKLVLMIVHIISIRYHVSLAKSVNRLKNETLNNILARFVIILPIIK